VRDSPSSGLASANVLAVTDGLKVERVNARWVATQVIKVHGGMHVTNE
jgi:hypothetical protein